MKFFKHKQNREDEKLHRSRTRDPRLHWQSAPATGGADIQSAPSSMLAGLTLEDAVLFNATRKIMNPPDKQFYLGILAGLWMGLGGVTAVSLAGGIPADVRARWLSLAPIVSGAVFAFGLHFINIFGGDLFTGDVLVMTVGYLNRYVTLTKVILHLVLVYVGNWCGCLLVAYFLGYLTHIYDAEQYRGYLDGLVQQKLQNENWGECFLRAIPANTFVCLAIIMGVAARGAAGKFIFIWFPIVMFFISGFEHCVANMFFMSVGLMYGAPSTIGRLWYNQSAAVAGNLVGGAIFVGLAAHLMNHWKSPIFSATEGTFQGHDLESTHRARAHGDEEAGFARSSESTRVGPSGVDPHETGLNATDR